jgi:hypothetical protein
LLPSALLVGAALAVPPTPSGRTCSVLDAFNRVATMPLQPLSPKHCAALDRGETVTLIQEGPDGHPRAIGLARTGLPKNNLWIASQDPHFSGEDLIEAPLQVRPHDSIWYGMLEIPRPFSNRHWVIHSTDNSALMASSEGRFCEHPWTVENERLPEVRAKVEAGTVPGLDLDHFDKAMATPVNEGALVFLDIGARDSLYLYHVTTDIGGMVPERVVAGYLRSTMGEHIRGIVERARQLIPRHYRGDHPPLHDCGDSTVPLFD